MSESPAAESDANEPPPLVLRRPRKLREADLDITPMIDITFLLLIYFLVASVPDHNASQELPRARYGVGVSKTDSLVLNVRDGGSGTAPVTIEDVAGEMSDLAEKQNDEIEKAVRDSSKTNVIIRADRNVAHREVARIASAASRVDGISIHFAVLEQE